MKSLSHQTAVATSHPRHPSGEQAPRRRSGRVDHAIHAAQAARVALERAAACR
jgi:hypothetical protein